MYWKYVLACVKLIPESNEILEISFSYFVSGVELSFKTRSPDGLLLCAFSPGNQEEFLAIQLKNGRPYFLFDPQVCYMLLHFYKSVKCECK